MAVYILHFSEPIGGSSPRGKASHYVGFTADTARRFKEHFNAHKNGSPLVAAAIAAGASVEVAEVYEDGDRELERKIKRSHNTRKYCPLCLKSCFNGNASSSRS